MKYIKSYENKNNYTPEGKIIYNENDFVLLSEPNDGTEYVLPYAKIIKRFKYKQGSYPIDQYQMELLFPNKNHWKHRFDDEHITTLPDYSIYRKLKPEELKNIKQKISTDKYNL